jgi:hypothetical protein
MLVNSPCGKTLFCGFINDSAQKKTMVLQFVIGQSLDSMNILFRDFNFPFSDLYVSEHVEYFEMRRYKCFHSNILMITTALYFYGFNVYFDYVSM